MSVLTESSYGSVVLGIQADDTARALNNSLMELLDASELKSYYGLASGKSLGTTLKYIWWHLPLFDFLNFCQPG